MPMGRIILLSGQIDSGKTSLCQEIVNLARQDGLRLGGLVSPAVFQEGQKIAIDLLDLKSGERRRLAEGSGRRSTDLQTQRWSFLPDAVAWGNQVLESALPCDLLVIDELGPLEFQRGQGWVAGFQAVDGGEYQAALLVIRPSLMEEALSRWDVKGIIDLDDPAEPNRTASKLYPFILGN